MTNIGELVDLLKLQKLSETVFLGQNYQSPWNRVFGGQVLAQALSAATQTVGDDRIVHSLHSYFLLAGDINIPIIYEVEKIRDGGSFSTRRVVAKQNGIAIFFLSASYQLKNQGGYEHSVKMPSVASPEEIESDEETIEKFSKWIPKTLADTITQRPFDFKVVEGYDLNQDIGKPGVKHVWFKPKQDFSQNLALNQQILTYASDYNLLLTATIPHTKGIYPVHLFLASLDHSVWFHREFTFDDWLLYVIDSPSASNSRGFAKGNIFTRSGELVASVAQEGLMRHNSK